MKQILIERNYFDKNDKLNFQIFLAKKGLTKTQFAKKCGLSNTYISFIITGKKPFSDELKEKFRKSGGFNINKDYSK